jgi:hypothetical protein
MGGEVNEEPIAQHLLKKYIMYARNHVRPQLHNIDTDKVCSSIVQHITLYCMHCIVASVSVCMHAQQHTAATVACLHTAHVLSEEYTTIVCKPVKTTQLLLQWQQWCHVIACCAILCC